MSERGTLSREEDFILKYKNIVFVILGMMLLLTGCKGVSQLNSTQIIIPPKNNMIPLQGTWEFVDYRRASDVQENQETISESKRLIGDIAIFSQEWAAVAEESCSDAEYQIRRVNARDYFLFHYNTDAGDLNINKTKVDIVSVTSQGALFFDIIKVDEDRAMIYMDRCFYWLNKVADEVDKLYADDRKDSKPQDMDTSKQDELLRTGVFIGLRSTIPSLDQEDAYGERSVYRTMWISSRNRKIGSTLEAPGLFIPRRSGFWTLNVRTRKSEDQFQDYFELKSVDSGVPHLKESKEEDMEVLEGNIKKNILFVGDDYMAIEYSQSLGPEIKEPDTFRVLPLDDANSQSGILVSHFAEEGMEDIFYKSAQSHLVSKSIRIDKDLKDMGQEDNFTMVRRNGHWTLRGRLNIGNRNEDFTIGLMPTGKIVSYDELHVPWDAVKERVPMALDAYTSPNKELLIVVTGNFIMVYTIEKGEISEKPIKKISIKKGESVIMAEWATGDYVARWEKGFNQVNPYMINE